MKNYRQLSDAEISQLKSTRCSSEEWSSIFVTDGFKAEFCSGVHFSGEIRIGTLGEHVFTISGMKKRSSITDAFLHNCTIGDHVYIRSVTSGIANYRLGDFVFIENVRLLSVECETSFANGVLVPVMNEQGGREIPMFTGLSAQIAYLLAFYRHRPLLAASLSRLIRGYVETIRSSVGTIGSYCKLINCDSVTNALIGPCAYLHGVKRLNNATINSSPEGPVEIGVGVIADSVIINGGSSITDSAIVDTCYISEGCTLAKHFSAEKSMFFSNFIGHHGEAFGIFAGPHTATHHKSTLLISAYMSFLNAGSGSNQSNHMYKLGPLHQGVMDRGSKTASDSYLLWPAHIGAFTLVMGRHMNHPDIRDLPYSYLIESEGESLLLPGVNFKSVGTIRDADKWPTRDNRIFKTDIINYDLLTPYTVGKMRKGYEILKNLIKESKHNERSFRYCGTIIPISAAEKGMEYYRLGIMKYVGNILAQRLETASFDSLDSLRQLLKPQTSVGAHEWSDMAGLTVPTEVIQILIERIEAGDFSSIEEICREFEAVDANYHEWSWNWCAAQLSQYLNKSYETITSSDIKELLKTWLHATKVLDDFFIDDANKEFSSRTKISFGIDGDSDIRNSDFTAVRGTIDDNSFVGKIRIHLEKKTAIFNTILTKLETI